MSEDRINHLIDMLEGLSTNTREGDYNRGTRALAKYILAVLEVHDK